MRGWRLCVVLAVGFAVLFGGVSTRGIGVALAQDISGSHVLRAWDGAGVSIAQPPAPLPDSRATLQRLGGSRLLMKVDASVLRRNFLASTQDDVRRVLREGRIGYTSLTVRDDVVIVRIRDSDDVARALAAIAGNAEPGKELGGSVTVRDAGDNVLQLTPVDTEFTESLGDAVTQAAAIMGRLVQQLALENATVTQVGPDSIEFILPGLTAPERLFEVIHSMARLDFRPILSSEALQVAESRQSPDAELLYGHKSKTPYSVSKRIVLPGGDIRMARAISDTPTGKPAIGARLGVAGTRRFAQFTADNVGRPVAIVLDNVVLAAPTIGAPIVEGMVRIDGAFTVDQAQELALLMRAGILPAPLTVVEKQIVAPAKP